MRELKGGRLLQTLANCCGTLALRPLVDSFSSATWRIELGKHLLLTSGSFLRGVHTLAAANLACLVLDGPSLFPLQTCHYTGY